jgi:mannose-6-phosphate isomerase-like protein (cupin superfamily)
MPIEKANLSDKFSRFSEHWQPKIVASVNDYAVKLAKVQGEFIWHKHDDTDELFLVVTGQLTIKLRNQESIVLNPGELVVIPRGVEHLPVADAETHILMLEPASTRNTGDVESDRTVSDLERL